VGREWGYEVAQCGAIGWALEKDPWGRDEALGGASQVAAFRRIDDDECVRMRTIKSAEWISRAQQEKPAHVLVHSCLYPAHPLSQQPSSHASITSAIKTVLDNSRDVYLTLEDLWFSGKGEVAVLCGGWIEKLVEAVEGCDELVLGREAERRTAWTVGYVHGALGTTASELEMELEAAEGYFPEVSREWGAESSRGDTSGAEADAEDNGEILSGSPVQWSPTAESRWAGHGEGSASAWASSGWAAGSEE
jgi:small RNA 2'-O-methyltransferase